MRIGKSESKTGTSHTVSMRNVLANHDERIKTVCEPDWLLMARQEPLLAGVSPRDLTVAVPSRWQKDVTCEGLATTDGERWICSSKSNATKQPTSVTLAFLNLAPASKAVFPNKPQIHRALGFVAFCHFCLKNQRSKFARAEPPVGTFEGMKRPKPARPAGEHMHRLGKRRTRIGARTVLKKCGFVTDCRTHAGWHSPIEADRSKSGIQF